MNIPKIKITLFALVCCWGLVSKAQLANITYTTQVNNVKSYENAVTGACWETGTESYTAKMYSYDNIVGSGTLQGGDLYDLR